MFCFSTQSTYTHTMLPGSAHHRPTPGLSIFFCLSTSFFYAIPVWMTLSLQDCTFLAWGAYGRGGWSQDQPSFRPPLHFNRRPPPLPTQAPLTGGGCKTRTVGGGANSRQSSSLFALPIPSQPSSSVLTAVSAAFSVSRTGHGARVLKGVCRGFRENETQGAALSVELRHQSFWDSQTKGGSSKGWILGPGDQGLKRC